MFILKYSLNEIGVDLFGISRNTIIRSQLFDIGTLNYFYFDKNPFLTYLTRGRDTCNHVVFDPLVGGHLIEELSHVA